MDPLPEVGEQQQQQPRQRPRMTEEEKTNCFFDIMCHLIAIILGLFMPKSVVDWAKTPFCMLLVVYFITVLTSNFLVIVYFIVFVVLYALASVGMKLLWMNTTLEYANWIYGLVTSNWNKAQEVVERLQPKQPTFTEQVEEHYHSLVSTVFGIPLPYFYDVCKLIGILIAVYMSYRILKYFVFNRIKNFTYRMRGFIGEARMPGSDFRQGEKPSCQVEIRASHMFGSKLVGYGARFRNVLVVPRHVIDSIRDYDILVVGKNASYLLSETPVSALKASDLLFYRLSEIAWSKLGVSAAKAVTVTDSVQAASITGPDGTSSGYIRKRQELGMVSYTGSTDFGFSGAVYYSNGSIYGMHTGSMDGINSGYSSDMVMGEIDVQFIGEVSTPEETDPDYNLNRKGKPKTWTTDMLVQKLQAAKRSNDERGPKVLEGLTKESLDAGRDEIKLAEELMEELTPAAKRVLLNKLLAESPKKMLGQSNDGKEIPITEQTADEVLLEEVQATNKGLLDIGAILNNSLAFIHSRIDDLGQKFGRSNKKIEEEFLIHENKIKNVLKQINDVLKYNLADRLNALEKDFKDLQMNIPAIKEMQKEISNNVVKSAVIKPVYQNRYLCDYDGCQKSFTSRMARRAHYMSKHLLSQEDAVELDRDLAQKVYGEVKKVSFKDNTNKIATNKKASFLDRRRSTGKDSPNTSISKKDESLYTLMLENRSKMSALMKELEKYSGAGQKDTDGPASEKQQN